MKHRILLVDDDQGNLIATQMLLKELGFEVDTATSGALALQMAEEKSYSVFLLDYQMPTLNGAQVASRLRKLCASSVILIYSCDNTREALKDCMDAGVTSFIEKDAPNEVLEKAVTLGCQKYSEATRLFAPIMDKTKSISILREAGMVGQSDKMAAIAQQSINYRNYRDTVLIFGETGSGKELVAKSVHGGSSDSFFALNCSAFTDQLMESEVFGYEEGAFTGANKRKAGILEIAGSGTVLLDEVEKLSLRAQGGLLRALREKKIRRVGGSKEISINCRIVAAAKPDLLKRVQDGEFLPDLYYRLNELSISIPPLREHKEDIGLLVDHFCKKHELKTGIKKTFREQTIRRMEKYAWPGNVGELEGCIKKLLVNAQGDIIEPIALDERFDEVDEDKPVVTLLDLEAKHELETRKLILAAIHSAGGSQRRAAMNLGMKNESSLRTLMGRLKLRPDVVEQSPIG